MSLAIGARLGSYEILASLGAGGMGEVYRARDTKLNRDVAVKILPDAFASDADRVSRFTREAQTLATLNHPHIAQIHGLEESSGVRALVMELVEGEDLAQRIARGAIAVDEAVAIATQIADGLEAAHEKGIIHRDLKPANIKLTPDGTVKILDFSLAKAAPASHSDASNSPTFTAAATQMGMIIGTAAYMSPEQARGKPVDKRADMWAFGCVLYEMLAGRQPFAGDNVTDIIASLVKNDPDWTALPASTPPHVRRIVERCLRKDPRTRLRDIGDVRLELEESAAPASATVTPALAGPRRPLWGRALLLALAAASLVTATTLVVWRIRPAVPASVVTRFSFPLADGQEFSGDGRNVAISPDGTQMVYIAADRLWLRSLDDFEARPIPWNESLQRASFGNVVFSPDGQSVAYSVFAELGEQVSIKRIALSGGASVTICAMFPDGMSWDADDIVFSARRTGDIMRVPARAGTPELLVQMKAGEATQSPQMLPGGNAVLFTLGTSGSDGAERTQVVVQILSSQQRKVVIDGGADARYVPTGHIVYAVGGTLFAVPFDVKRLETTGAPTPVLVGIRRNRADAGLNAQFSVSRTGSIVYVPGSPSSAPGLEDLAFVDRTGRVERLELPPRTYRHPRMSPDGARITFETMDGKESNVYVYDVGAGTAMRRLTFGGNNRFPIWSADGKRVAYQSDREGDRGIFWQAADGSGAAERLTKAEDGATHVPQSWAPSTSRFSAFVYTVTNDTTTTLWSLSLPERKSARLGHVEARGIGSGIGTGIDAVFSPDGKWIAYADYKAAYVQPFPATGAQYQLPKVGADHGPMWSADGREVLYEPAQNQLVAVPIRTQPAFAAGAPVSLPQAGRFGSAWGLRNRDLAPDGKRFIAPVSLDQLESGSTASPEIRVVLNWFEELKAKLK